MACLHASGKPDDLIYPAELLDDGYFRLKCRNGHDTVIVLQEQRFEYLSELAANAVVDGYYREAVASFASALERFYEYYIRIVARKHKIADALLSDVWKQIKSQSERQLGAYIVLYMIENSLAPTVLDQKAIAFRNRVIHGGKIPSKDEAIEFGENVAALIRPIISELFGKAQELIDKEAIEHSLRLWKGAPKGEHPISSLTYPTFISLNRKFEDGPPALRHWVQDIENRRRKSGWS